MTKMRFFSNTIFTTCMAVAFSSGAYATTDEPWYVLAGFGFSNAATKTGDYMRIHNYVGVAANNHGYSAAGKLLVGYRFNRYIALEGGYCNLGKTKTYAYGSTNIFSPTTRFGALMKAQGVIVDFVASTPMDFTSTFFGKVGLAMMHTQSTLTLGKKPSVSIASGTENRIVPKFGIGSEYFFSPSLAMRIEWDYFPNLVKNSEKGVKTNVHLVTLGMKYTF